jgi:hypothetical protein
MSTTNTPSGTPTPPPSGAAPAGGNPPAGAPAGNTPPAWAQGVPQQYVRDTPEATTAELARALTNAQHALSSRQPETPTTPPAPNLAFPDALKAIPTGDLQALVSAVAAGQTPPAELAARIGKTIKGVSDAEAGNTFARLLLTEHSAQQLAQSAKAQSDQVAVHQMLQTNPTLNATVQAAMRELTGPALDDLKRGLASPATAAAAIERAAGQIVLARAGSSATSAAVVGTQPQTGFTSGRDGGDLRAAMRAAEKVHGQGNALRDPTFAARFAASSPEVKRGVA